MAQDNEVNIDDVFDKLKHYLKGFLRLIFKLFGLIYAKKIVFLVLIVIGIIIGFFLDSGKPNEYDTTLQIRTLKESTEYVYDLVGNLNQNLEDTSYLKANNFAYNEIKEVEITPMANMEDLLSTFKGDDSQTLETLILNTSTQDLLTSEFFRSQYRQHQVKLRFGKAYTANSLKHFLNFLNNNPYYQKLHEITQNSLTTQIVQDGKTVVQIDTLIANYNRGLKFNNNTTSATAVVGERQTSAAYNLLNFRKDLITEIEDFKKEKDQLQKPVVLTNKPVVLKKKRVLEKYTLSIPLLLVSLFLIFLIAAAMIRRLNTWSKKP